MSFTVAVYETTLANMPAELHEALELLTLPDNSWMRKLLDGDLDAARSAGVRIFVAYAYGRVVGWATAHLTLCASVHQRPAAFVELNLFVDPGFRREGVGKELLRAACCGNSVTNFVAYPPSDLYDSLYRAAGITRVLPEQLESGSWLELTPL